MTPEQDGPAPELIETPSGPISVRRSGSGQPLLFVHGWGVNATLWSETARRLTDSYECILPDLPFGSHAVALREGADLSPPGAARIVADLIEALGLERVTLVGNDSGGAVCQILVTAEAGLVNRLVLTNSDCLDTFPPGTFKLLTRVLRVPGAIDVLVRLLQLRAVQRSPIAYGALTRGRIEDRLLDAWVRPPRHDRGVRRDSAAFGRGMDPVHTLAAADRFGELEIPVLLVWGEADRFFTIEHAERLAELIPDSRLVRVPGGRTFLPLDEPALLAREIAAFAAHEGPAGDAARSDSSRPGA